MPNQVFVLVAIALLHASSCSAPRDASMRGDTSSTGEPPPPGTCREIIARIDASASITDNFWICKYECGPALDLDTLGDQAIQSAESFDRLEPGDPDMCYELRLALYECFAQLDCKGIDEHYAARRAGADGPCVQEFLALEPNIDECGI